MVYFLNKKFKIITVDSVHKSVTLKSSWVFTKNFQHGFLK